MPPSHARCALVALVALVGVAGPARAQVLTSGTDLQAVSVSGPATATAGANLALAVRFTNTGSDPVSQVKYRVLLSTDKTIDANDRLIHEVSVPVSGAQTIDQQLSVALPSGIGSGDYYFVLIVDSNNAVAESNENNNTVFSASPLKVELPDLAITAVDFLDANGVSTRTGYLGQPAKIQ
ncbi:MAG: CARDB domain-containing protein, partial [Myxococcaceae bacterium]